MKNLDLNTGSEPEGAGGHPKASVNPDMHGTPIAYVAPLPQAVETVKGNIDDQWDDDSTYGPLEKQIAKSVRKTMARAAKKVYNAIEKRIDPNRNNKKRNRQFKLPWLASAAICDEEQC